MGPGEEEQGFSEQIGDVGSGDTGSYGSQANDAGDSSQDYGTEYASGQSGSEQEAGECAVCYHGGITYSEGDSICVDGQRTQVCKYKDGRLQWVVSSYGRCGPQASANESGGEDSTAYGEGTEYAAETEEPAEYSNV
jgi:hypothetical protein